MRNRSRTSNADIRGGRKRAANARDALTEAPPLQNIRGQVARTARDAIERFETTDIDERRRPPNLPARRRNLRTRANHGFDPEPHAAPPEDPVGPDPALSAACDRGRCRLPAREPAAARRRRSRAHARRVDDGRARRARRADDRRARPVRRRLRNRLPACAGPLLPDGHAAPKRCGRAVGAVRADRARRRSRPSPVPLPRACGRRRRAFAARRSAPAATLHAGRERRARRAARAAVRIRAAAHAATAMAARGFAARDLGDVLRPAGQARVARVRATLAASAFDARAARVSAAGVEPLRCAARRAA